MLLEAINSCLKQTQKSLEVIVFDDGSTDGTDELMKTVTDERVRYFRSEKNVGGGRIFGLKHARGKYITFLDHDDYYTDYEFFERAIKVFEEHEHDSETPIAFVSSNALEINTVENSRAYSDIGEPGRLKGVDYILSTQGIYRNGKVYSKPLSVFPTVFRADFLRSIDFDKYLEGDGQLYVLNALLGDAWYMPEPVGVHRVHSGSERYGVKNNPEYDKRRKLASIKSIRTWQFIRDNLRVLTDKKTADLWYTNRCLSIMKFAALSQKNLAGIVKSYIHICKNYDMSKLWLLIPLDFTPWFIRRKLRRITPLRNFYRFLKYKCRGLPYPED
ncbi:MAG: glycosyltransferase family 2 protein [Synergistaceae bacterium]|nr:glycosyltransferase family 2 protein [Synergistaceae bacterium]